MNKLHYHSSIEDHLVALAALDGMLTPNELICGWFDDLYFPSVSECPNDHPRETWERGQREWRECFNSAELQILSDFHQIFSLHVDSLRETPADWRLDSHWLAIRDAAKVALNRYRSAT